MAEGGRTDRDVEDTPEQRLALLKEADELLEIPMAVFGLAWLVLLVIELAWHLTPALEIASTVVWVLFVVDFALKLLLAPNKVVYLRHEWLAALSLFVPALRFFRVLRVFSFVSATQGFGLLRFVTAMNRGMRALREVFRHRGVGYVAVLTVLVWIGGSAGMYAFERGRAGELPDYPTALWWTAMLLTTIGSEKWPQTGGGRALCLILSIYATATFGYVTAALASLFVDRPAR